MVFSKLGGAGSFAMRWISARFSAMPASSAGLKSGIWTRSNGGIPPYGPSQFASSGLSSVAACDVLVLTSKVTARSSTILPRIKSRITWHFQSEINLREFRRTVILPQKGTKSTKGRTPGLVILPFVFLLFAAALWFAVALLAFLLRGFGFARSSCSGRRRFDLRRCRFWLGWRLWLLVGVSLRWWRHRHLFKLWLSR